MSATFAQVAGWVAAASYFVAATLFLLGLQRMASPVTARSGIRWAGLGMVIATVLGMIGVAYNHPGLMHFAAGANCITAIMWIWE